MDPTNLWANRNLGACLAQERRLEQAKEYFLKALETLLKLAHSIVSSDWAVTVRTGAWVDVK
jgi:Tfp pilus assembly protein PilF